MSIRSGDIRDQSIKLSIIAPKFLSLPREHLWTSLVRLLPLGGPNVIRPNTLNRAPVFEFLLPQIFFSGAPKFLDLTYKVPPIFSSLGKISRRSAEAARRYSLAKCQILNIGRPNQKSRLSQRKQCASYMYFAVAPL